MKKRVLATIITLAILSVLCLAGCGEKKEDKTINIGYFNNITHAQALYMKSQGSLETALGEEVTVNWTAFNAGPAEVEALFAESIDIGYIGPVPAINANVKSDGDVQILSGATKGGAILIKRAGVNIQSVADLSGKTVAIPQIGNTQHLGLLYLLEQNGLKPTTEGGDVTVSAVANADVANMMDRGDIDAAFVPEPWGATLLEMGAEMVLDYDEVFYEGHYDVAVVVVRKEFMEEHPEYVKAFLAQHEAATLAINSNAAIAISQINAELNEATGKSLSQSVIEEAFGRIGVSTDLNKESVAEFAKIGVTNAFIGEAPEESELYVD